ncbi:DUF4350 domain-containing protein [Thermopolyspora sp. NPDC052614]|uniref:DUF4350 domain-containing protein n=1 Tax=Thermopolyspora sp. NPDC052614 TaxID=3155682 RepID=UPI00342D6325
MTTPTLTPDTPGTPNTSGTPNTPGTRDPRTAPDVSTSISPTGRSLWRSARGIVAIALILLLGATITVLLSGDGESRPLDPRDTGLDGSAALAALLEEEGVRVHRVTSGDEAATLARPGTLLLITASGLDEDMAKRLAALASDRMIVGIKPGMSALAPGVKPEDAARTRSREPDCPLRQAVLAGSAFTGGVVFTAPNGASGCYRADGKPSLVRYETGGRTITVVGSGEFMTNLRLDEDGNAALAMNLAGQRDILVWLTDPAPGDPGYAEDGVAGPGGASLYDLMPDGVGWAAVQLCVAVLLAAVWQGRRLGPVVAERLPVVVRAAETVEGRGRLYRARRARDRASAALRAACLDRVTPRLGLSRTAGPDEIIASLAARTGEDALELRSLLYGPAPTDDAALVALAGRLDALEAQIRENSPTGGST